MDKDTRNAIERATQRARKLLEEDFAAQLEGDFDVHRDGAVAAKAGGHLSARQAFQRERIVAAIEHKRAAGMIAADAARDYLRDAAFTTLNRFVALKMLEARDLVQECITKGEQSAGYREFCGMAPGLPLLPESAGYRLYLESLFDELSTEVKVLFDRRDPSSVLWPKRATFEQLLEILNATDLVRVWGEDETIGWVYQFFNGQDERRKMREESQAPRNSRELAVRNQFFTPRYVVQFLTDNTLGRIWYEMRGTKTVLAERCEYMVRKPREEFALRMKKDPRDLRVLDPACGSGHFLLYAFDLLLAIYEEAYADRESPTSEATGNTLAEDYSSVIALRKALPGLVLEHNLHGVDIDPRCVQIAQLALWMRAQKAYRDFGIGRAERAQIRRSSIVVAEPLVADDQIAKDFVAKLGDVELGRAFIALVESLSLAGELGLLLRAEKSVAHLSERNRTGDLFAPPEERIRAALGRFAGEEGGRANMRRRLFVDDAAHGLALLSIAEKSFDTVVMNPPFGLLTKAGQAYVRDTYSGAHNDVFATFVRRGKELCTRGLVGVISSRSFLVAPRLETFRRDDVLPSLRLLWDLGLGVMDAAAVESAAYVLGPAGGECFSAADGRAPAGPDTRLPRHFRDVRRDDLSRLPLAKLLYNVPDEVHRTMALPQHMEPTVATAREGMKSFENERFVRLFWEVDNSQIGADWRRFAKGGRNLRVFGKHILVLRHHRNGAELDEKNLQLNGTTAQVRQASTYWGRAGITYSRRATEFAARFLPAGFVFSDDGPAILPLANVSVLFLLGWLNSRAVRYLIHLQANKQKYLTGILKVLPWSAPSAEMVAAVERAVYLALKAWMASETRSETSPFFSGPGNANSALTQLREWKEVGERTKHLLNACLETCDAVVDRMYEVDSAKWPGLAVDDRADEEADQTIEDDQSNEEFCVSTTNLVRLISWAVGCALGRWRVDSEIVEDIDPFRELPSCPPAMHAGAIDDLVLPEDQGHPKDLARRVIEVCAERWRVSIDEVSEEFQGRLGPDGLRNALRAAKGESSLWAYHLASHTAHHRVAPALLRLAIHADGYSLWINLQRAQRDTLYVALHSFVEPKLRFEEARLIEMQRDKTKAEGRAGQRDLGRQESVVDDLRMMRNELLLAAPVWVPNRSDGTVVSLAPLWRLCGFDRAFQREVQTAWQMLCGGNLEWSQSAMRLWPERVVPKCAKDRSYAVAHGLEDVFWVEVADGKWTARRPSTKSIDELVKELTSPAVKSALKSLLEAPAAAGKSGGRGGGRRKSAAAAVGGDA